MSAATKVLKDSTSSLLAYPQLTSGGPVQLEQASAVTVRIRTPAVSLPDAGEAGTVDSISAVTGADAAEGDTLLTVTVAKTWVRGRQYLLTLTTGEVLVVTAAKGGSSVTLRLTEPLPSAALTGSTVLGYAVTKALSAEQTAQLGEGLALWTAAMAAGAVTFSQQFRIVRRIPSYTLTWGALTTAFPIVHTLRARTDLAGDEFLRAVWDMRLLPALEGRGIRAEQVIGPERLEAAHATMCVHHLLALDPARDGTFVDRWQEEARVALDLALSGKETWVDLTDDESVPPRDEDAPPEPFTYSRWGR